jgi:hypothetical protein
VRRRITWVVAGAVAALAVAGVVDAVLRSDGDSSQPSAANGDEVTSVRAEPAALPACRREQLALSIEILGGGDVFVLRHVRGGPCRLPAARVTVKIRDGRDRQVQVANAPSEVSGDFAPDVEFVGLLTYLITCREDQPIRVTVRVGRYTARRLFPLPSYCPG